MRGDAVKGHLDLLVLAVLDGSPAHGYLVIERLRERSAGAFGFPEGTIYPALHRLERAGLLASRWATTPRRRRVYELTQRGREEPAARPPSGSASPGPYDSWWRARDEPLARPDRAPLEELRRTLPRVGRDRLLAEAEDHLREAAARVGEEEAVARFGSAHDLARGLAPLRAEAWTRLAALSALAAAVSFVLAYPVYENNLPPRRGRRPRRFRITWRGSATRSSCSRS